jgi:hypothetical protein
VHRFSAWTGQHLLGTPQSPDPTGTVRRLNPAYPSQAPSLLRCRGDDETAARATFEGRSGTSIHLKRLFLVGLVGVVLAALMVGGPRAFAAGSPRVVATFSVHPVPGSGPSAGGGGVLFDGGSVSGLISTVDLADDETLHAIPLRWRFLSENQDVVEICFEFIVVRGEAELPPGTVLCVPFPVGQSVVAPENVVVTVRLIHRR